MSLKKFDPKNVLVTSALGAALGAYMGKQSKNPRGNIALGAGIGALVGIVGAETLDSILQSVGADESSAEKQEEPLPATRQAASQEPPYDSPKT